MPSSEGNGGGSGQRELGVDQLAVETRMQRRTALVALHGELDLVSVSKVAEVLDGLEPHPDGVRHVVLDLRGLTFMDVVGLRELLRQNEYARANRHNLAVVRGTDAIDRVLELTDVKEQLVLVDDPDDLVPPPSPADAATPTLEAASFDITLTRSSGRVTLTLVGELDLATTPRLEKYLTTIGATPQELIVIDLRRLTFMDSTGVAALVAADRHARRAGRRLAIVKGPPQVQRVLEICGLTEVLALADEPLGTDGEDA